MIYSSCRNHSTHQGLFLDKGTEVGYWLCMYHQMTTNTHIGACYQILKEIETMRSWSSQKYHVPNQGKYRNQTKADEMSGTWLAHRLSECCFGCNISWRSVLLPLLEQHFSQTIKCTSTVLKIANVPSFELFRKFFQPFNIFEGNCIKILLFRWKILTYIK